MKLVIIGGDAAGMSAASRAKRTLPDLEITVLEKTRDVSFSACGMPYNIADPNRPMEDLIVRTAEAFQKQGIEVRTGHKATQIDRSGKKVHGATSDGAAFSVPYDALLIATGASPEIPPIPGMDLPGVAVLKHLDDGRRIKAYIREKKVGFAVIIGMGYIALEMCEALRDLGIGVAMIKPRPGLLPWMNERLSSMIVDELSSRQVDMAPGTPIHAVKNFREGLVVQCGDREWKTDLVLVATGVSPNSGIAEKAGILLSVQRSISTDRYLRTSDPDIYAAGDCADAFHLVTGQKTWIPLALRANRAGWAAADNICGKPVALPGIVGTAVFRVFDLEVARTGLSLGEARKAGFSPVEVVIESRSRAHAHPGASMIRVQMVGDRTTGRLLGVQMVGREGVAHRINAAAVALHNGMTVSDFSQTDLSYAPPFGPVWDPLLTAANQLIKKL
jgi:NADPH-dependent 2,4-dienoyl-CoA reductase/sulfur reductase-like enzyme